MLTQRLKARFDITSETDDSRDAVVAPLRKGSRRVSYFNIEVVLGAPNSTLE